MDKIEAALTRKKTMLMSKKRGKKQAISVQSSDGADAEEVKSDVASGEEEEGKEKEEKKEKTPVDPN